MFYLYTLNGKFIRTADAHEHPNVILTTRDGEFLISGGKKSTVLIRSIFEYVEFIKQLNFRLHSLTAASCCRLRVVERFTLSAPVSSLVLSSDEKYILVGQEDGNLAVLEVDFASLPKIGPAAKLRRQQTSIGV
jgi:WD40 repeat protein